MKKVIFCIFCITYALNARENPFFPAHGEQDLPITTNTYKDIAKLQKASLQVPENARVIKKVTIEFENLDASSESKTIELNNAIDWHLPIFISQSYTQQQQQVADKKVDKPLVYKNIAELESIAFMLLPNKMKIKSSDKLLRNFLLTQPHRIVLDYEREAKMKNFTKIISDSVFSKIRIGNHDGYYRVVIELDGYYRYKLQQIEDGCLLTLQ